MNEYQKDRPGFNRREACRGHFNSEPIELVDSDDGMDYVDWDAMSEGGYPRGVEYTYRIIDGKTIRFKDGERLTS